MAPTIVHLPNGQTLTVTTVFGGLFFKSNELASHSTVFPPGWTVVLHSEDHLDEPVSSDHDQDTTSSVAHESRHSHIHRYTTPTLRNDNLFISSISNPSNNDFKPATSPTRQVAMMLWATLYWYFHQPEPSPYLTTESSKHTPEKGRPKGDWRINIKKEGVLRGRHLIQKLERMGLIASEDSRVGSSVNEGGDDGWTEMFVSRRSYWQLPATLFLFTLKPTNGTMMPGSPYGSRPNSPVRGNERSPARAYSPNKSVDAADVTLCAPPPPGFWNSPMMGPFASGSHLPTYYPPPPVQYTVTKGVRHPIRPKPPRQGETFYTRYVPSVGQYLSFRVASLATHTFPHVGPVSSHPEVTIVSSSKPISSLPSRLAAPTAIPEPLLTSPAAVLLPTSGTTSPNPATADPTQLSDVSLLNRWMNNPRVSAVWGVSGPASVQESFLKHALDSKHSFPVIGYWDDRPFGFFELYWAKEDQLARYLGSSDISDWDRGIHVLVGEEEFRGWPRLKVWMGALVHWAFGADYRTDSVVMEPRIDNDRFIKQLEDIGYCKEKEITFPFKQAAYMRWKRENFEAPYL